jgi:cytochrome P450
MVVITDYASIENLLTKHSHSLERSEFTGNLFQGILPKAQISLPTNEMWKHHRRIIGTSMTSKYLALTTPRANESIKKLIEYWRVKMAKAGKRVFQADQDMENATMDAICGMAFGSNWGILQSFQDQVSTYEPSTGELDEAVFPVKKPEMLQSVMYLFEHLPLKTIFPKTYHFFLSKTPTWRRHNGQLSKYLDEKLRLAREKAKSQGADASVELADNTLDLMVARELRGEDWMPDKEMKDEVYQYLLGGSGASIMLRTCSRV